MEDRAERSQELWRVPVKRKEPGMKSSQAARKIDEYLADFPTRGRTDDLISSPGHERIRSAGDSPTHCRGIPAARTGVEAMDRFDITGRLKLC
jgi:hypothetical protein